MDLKTTNQLPNAQYDAIVHAVSHNEFKEIDFKSLRAEASIVYDVKGVLEGVVDGKL